MVFRLKAALLNYSLTLGTKMFIPGFEDQLLGHKAGDEVDKTFLFPEDYHAAEN